MGQTVRLFPAPVNKFGLIDSHKNAAMRRKEYKQKGSAVIGISISFDLIH